MGFVTKSETSVVVAAASGTLRDSGVVAAVKRFRFVGGFNQAGSLGWGGGPKSNDRCFLNFFGIFMGARVWTGVTGVVAAVTVSLSVVVAVVVVVVVVLWNALLPL